MKTLLKKMSGWLGGNQATPSHSAFTNSRNAQQSVLPDGSETATRGQLVQVLLRDLLRKSGMPASWVQAQIQVMNSRTRGQGIYVRLVVKHWDERLMTYAFAFQKALLTEIVQFEPNAASWLHGIAWQLEVAGSCPLTELPGPDFWQQKAGALEPDDQFDIIPLPAHKPIAPGISTPAPRAAPATVLPTPPALPVAAAVTALPLTDEPTAPQDDTAQDLARLFAIRDNELANLASDNLLPVGYERTAPSPLQR